MVNNLNMLLSIWYTFALFLMVHGGKSCLKRSYGSSSFVCVCNSTYCDILENVLVPSKGEADLYESIKNESVFLKSTLKFASSPLSGNIANVNRSVSYQFIVGFGGAFTDTAGINIASLPLVMQKQIINGYYSESGLEYSMGRIPMASCDFSTRVYSYDDVDGDFNLTHFQLAPEDYKFKIPYIKMAQAVSKHELLLFGSPWSAPAWMKTSNNMSGDGSLKGNPGDKYYQTWADYFVRFLKEYEKANVSLWGITAQNEPTTGYLKNYSFQTMGFTAKLQRDFIKLNLGPTLQKAGYGVDKLRLMIMDDERVLLPLWADVVLGDPVAASYVSGIAFHWYLNSIAPASILDVTHNKHDGVFILPTEACTGSNPWDLVKVVLGSWERAEAYAHDIIQDLLHWSVGWIDWNLALDLTGGPNWAKNFVDAPIIVNASGGEFYRQPMYYALAHFSKLLPPGTQRIQLDLKDNVTDMKYVDIAAFETPEDATVVIIVNRGDADFKIAIKDVQAGYLNVVSRKHSIQSYIWSSK